MKLYFHPFSHNSRRARAVALHLGYAFEPIVVDVPKGANKAPEFLALNPNGMIPVLDDEGFVLNESMAIATYLADKRKSDVFPQDLRARADVTRWLAWEQAHFNPACTTLVFERVFKKMFGGQADEKAVEGALQKFHRFAAVLDAQLAKGDFICGSKVTLADFACAAPLTHAAAAEIPVAQYKNVARWLEKMKGVAGWKESAPPAMG